MRSVDVARVLGLLPQTPVAPDGITVGDLVGRGRYPHQGWFRRWSAARRRRGRRGARGDRHRRPRRPQHRRAVGRPAPARLGRDGARPGHRPAAARRADDVPRHQPPGRAARPAHRPQPHGRQDDRDRAARPQPGVPLRRPRRRDEGRRDRRARARRATSSTPTLVTERLRARRARSCPTRSAARRWSCRAGATTRRRRAATLGPRSSDAQSTDRRSTTNTSGSCGAITPPAPRAP